MKAKSKKILIGVSAVALVGAISVSGTISYLTHLTEQRVNNFTFAADGLDANLTESKWDGVVGYEYDGNKVYPVYDYVTDTEDVDGDNDREEKIPVYGYTHDEDGNDIPITDRSKVKDPNDVKENRKRKDDSGGDILYGDTVAENMRPGLTAEKDPTVTNTGKLDEWVAVKVSFVYSDKNSENKGKLIPDSFVNSVIMPIIDVNWTNPGGIADTMTDDSGDGKWYLKGGTELDTNKYTNQMTFYYSKLLKPGESTDAVFDSISMKLDPDSDQADLINKLDRINGFAIYVEGYAVQGDKYKTGKEWVQSGSAQFTNSPSEDDQAEVGTPGFFGSPDKLATEPETSES